ncbi:MAG: ATPase [Dactylosporangium sp.]|nr:nitrate- and nitrite sensing domain-containing protein [Dactylosporangium sp.]NNJ60446.1 ATPase [Dactylosporangium sp.]
MPASRVVGGRLPLRLPSLANVRIRSKLVLILVVPILAILTLTALRLSDARERATDAQLVGALTLLSADASRVAHEVHHERMHAAVLLADSNASTETYATQIKQTDSAVATYNANRNQLENIPGNVADRLQRTETQLSALSPIREAVTARQGISGSETALRYGFVIGELVSFQESLAQVTSDPDLADALAASAALSKAKALLGDEEATVYPALVAGVLDAQQFSAFIATLTGQQEALLAFSLAANTEQIEVVQGTIGGDAVQLADDVSTELTRSASGKAPDLKANEASSALGAVNDLMRFAEQQIEADLIATTKEVSSAVRREVLIESMVIIAVLVLALGFAFGTARSMARTLHRLRNGALAVADYELAEAVNKLRDAQAVDERTPEQIAGEVRDPIGIDTRDEVGEVAKAFHIVHREAVRIAAEQAVLRASISAMFLNLARRSQTLVDRMIGQLDSIERNEEDPKRLAQLFKLDHLATRMRRNDENVLVLAGSDSTPPRRDDAPLFDILRAAQSEVEQYERIEFGTIDDDVSVAARAVNDVVRLLAELLDNATRLSPPSESVTVEARRVGDRVHMQIEDRGIGMDPATVHAHNARFAAPPVIDVTTFRMMGLAVIGRLAYRHGIGIQLRENPGGGTTAELMFPAEILILPPIWVRQEPAMRPLAATPTAPPPAAPPPVSLANAPTAPHTTVSGPPARAWNGHQPSPANAPTAGRMPSPMEAVEPPQSWPTPLATTPQSMPAPSAGRPPAHAPMVPPAPLVPPAPPAVPAPRVPQDPQPSADGAPTSDDTTELPIYREIEAAWFRTHGNTAAISVYTPAGPASGTQPRQSTTPPQPAVRPTVSAGSPAGQSAVSLPTRSMPIPAPASPTGVGNRWRTKADDGWRAAAAAEEPPVDKKTRTGLPKRNPGAQLVPGSVEEKATARTRRTPDQVRGLLSTYQRGVQRGRTATGGTDGGTPTPGTAEGSGK